jgi:hypothetical protein
MDPVIFILLQIYTAFCLIGFIGNLLALIVFSRKKFQNTIFSTYFRILCSIDCLVLLNRIDYILWKNEINTFRFFSVVTCKLEIYISYLLPASSTWILLLISLDRLISIVKPSKFLFRKKIKYQLLACLALFAYNLLFFIPVFIFVEYKTSNNETKPICINKYPIINALDIFSSILIPFISMLLCSIFTVVTIFKSRKSLSTSNNIQKMKDIRFSITTIGLNLSFFILTIPLDVFIILKLLINFDSNFDFVVIFSFLFYSNYGLIFYVTILININFRNEFLNLCSEIKFKFFGLFRK